MTSGSKEIPCYPNTNYYVDEKGVLHIDNVKGYRMVTEYVRERIRAGFDEVYDEQYAAQYHELFGGESNDDNPIQSDI